MSALGRYASLRRLQVVLGLALMGLVLAPSASGAAQLDTATASGSTSNGFSNINISAQSGTSGQNPSGTVSFTVVGLNLSGAVTCLSVTGPDKGGGTLGSPTTAVINFQNTVPPFAGINTVELVDNGGNGADLFTAAPTFRAPSDCSPLGVATSPLNGRAVVFDAPPLPTSKDQCKKGGWRNFGSTFKNQGDCVSFVENGK
jgi:hypothetical protein